MQKNLLLLVVTILFVACDSGDIEEKTYTSINEGQTVKLTATVTGLGAWDDDYSVALAGFNESSNYAVMQNTLPISTADGTSVELVLSNLVGQVSTVEFAITNRLRERILTLATVQLSDYSEEKDTIRLDLGTIDVSPWGSLQSGVFDVACIQCHGGNGRSAAGLNLTEGNAYGQLVDVPSTRISGAYRVVSGQASQSLLHQILSEGGEDLLHVNHTEILSNQFKNNLTQVRQFIEDWIDDLKGED